MSRLAHCSLPTSIPIHIYAHGFKWNAKSIYQFERESGVIKRHRNIRFSSVPIAFSFFYRNKCMMHWNSSSEQIKSTMKNNCHERLFRKKERRQNWKLSVNWHWEWAPFTEILSILFWNFSRRLNLNSQASSRMKSLNIRKHA